WCAMPVFFFSSRRRHTRFSRDWSSDVCSSDLLGGRGGVMAQLVAGYVMRPVEARDEQAVLALVNADWVPGQPRATPAMLAEALAGRSGVDSGWWAELAELTTEVATTRAGQVVGVVSYAIRPRDGAGG